MKFPNRRYSNRFSNILLLIGFCFLIFAGCNGQSSAGNNDPEPVEPQGSSNLAGMFDAENMWLSSRNLGEALVANSDEFDLPGAFAFYRFAYLTGFAGADKVASKKMNEIGWDQNPKKLNSNPQEIISILDDFYASLDLNMSDPPGLWEVLEEVYGPLKAETIDDLNQTNALGEDGTMIYGLDGAGFYSQVDHKSLVLGIMSLYDLDHMTDFSVNDALLRTAEKSWEELPEDADGNVDLIGLMEMYDVVTFPYVLDLAYRETGEPGLFLALESLMLTYAEAVDPETLYDQVDGSSNREGVMRQLCDLSRLLRRMYTFLDDDLFVEKGESILKSIGDLCLTASKETKLAYVKALVTFEEAALHIVITGPSDEEAWREMRLMSLNRFDPRMALMALDNTQDEDLIDKAGYYPTEEPKAFVCVDAFCWKPVADSEELNGVFLDAEKEFTKMRDRKNKDASEEEK